MDDISMNVFWIRNKKGVAWDKLPATLCCRYQIVKNVFKTRSWSMRLSKYVYAGFIKLSKISYIKMWYFLYYILELFITYFQTLSNYQNLIFELTILDVRGFGFPKWRTQNYFFRTIVDVCTTIHSRLKHG